MPQVCFLTISALLRHFCLRRFIALCALFPAFSSVSAFRAFCGHFTAFSSVSVALLGFLWLGAAPLWAQSGPPPADDLRALIKRVETQHRGDTSHGKTRMNIRTKDWARTLVMETWSIGRDRFLVKIIDPAKEKGTCTLKVESEIWNFFPKIDRLMKIPSSLMGDKWMGSHFTNDDLVKDNKIEELYDLTKESGDEKIMVIKAVPKPTAAVVWGKILYTIDLEKTVPITVDYYDEAGVKVRTIAFDQIKMISNRWLAMRMRVIPVETPEESTEMLFESLEFDLPLPSNLFSIQSLRKR
jgi:hypothetical protein